MSNTTESQHLGIHGSTEYTGSQSPVALITGGAKGIGRETAKLFLTQGYRVAVCGRDQEALNRFYEQYQSDHKELKAAQGVLVLLADITKPADCQRVVNQVVGQFGRIDVLVNNAGMAMRGTFQDTDFQVYRTLLDINFLGALTMTQLALPHLVSSKGSVIFVSTLAGLFGLPGVGAYSASKMPLTALAQGMQIELSSNIHTGILYVSFTENDPGKLVYQADGSLAELHRSKNVSTQEDVAQAIVAMVRFRKKRKIMSPMGNLADWFFRWFPNLTVFLISRFGKQSSMGGTTGTTGITGTAQKP